MDYENTSNRVAGLEVLRFACAFGVLLSHYPIFLFTGPVVAFTQGNQPFYSILSPFYERGFFAVPYFWCISGFIFFWKYQHSLRQRIGALDFFVLRFSRLYPLHLATLLLVAAIQLIYLRLAGSYFTYTENTFANLLQHLLMVGNWRFPNHMSYNGPVWSVSVEVAAYATFFVVCRYFSRSSAIASCIAVVCLYTFLRHDVDIPVVNCLTFFYLGGIVCFVYRWIEQRRLTVITAATLLIYYAVLCLFRDHITLNGYAHMVICIPFVVLAFACVPMPRGRLTAKAVWAGNLTYAIYLLHFPIMLTIKTICAAFGVSVPYESKLFFLGFLSLIFLASIGCYRFYEMPMQRLLRRYLLPKRGRASAISVT